MRIRNVISKQNTFEFFVYSALSDNTMFMDNMMQIDGKTTIPISLLLKRNLSLKTGLEQLISQVSPD